MTVHTYPKAKNFSADFYLSRYTKEDASRRSFLSPRHSLPPACCRQSTGKALRTEATPPHPHGGCKSKRGPAGGATRRGESKGRRVSNPHRSQGPDIHLLTEQLSLKVLLEELGHDGHLGTICSRSGRDASTTTNACSSSRG